MKPINDQQVTHHGTTSGANRVEMSLDENSLAHLMSLLTDTYSDPELAVIREYATNGWDAHRAIGSTDPIEVTLPTALDPTYVVRDNGIGMSVDDLLNVFSKYGASTKRGTDAQTGMLGIGCKSALTYTSQFTVVSRHDGVEVSALVLRGESGVGEIEIVDTRSTTDRNGVEIRVPVAYPQSFAGRAREFFQFWTDGTALVDGEVPTLPEPHIRVSDDLVLFPTSVLANDVVVQGHVPYHLPRYGKREISSTRREYSALLTLDIGSVNFTPSREALNFTPATEAVLDLATDYVRMAATRFIREDIEKAPTYSEALKRFGLWDRPSGMRWGGRQLTLRVPFTGWDFTFGSNRAESITSLRSDEVKALVWGIPTKSLTVKQRDKIRRFYEGENLHRVFASVEMAQPFWATDDVAVSWADIDAVVPDPPKSQRIRSAGRGAQVEVYSGGYWESAYANELDDDLPFVIVSDDTAISKNTVRSLINKGLASAEDYRFVVVPNRSQAKFSRENTVVPRRAFVSSMIALFRAQNDAESLKAASTEAEISYQHDTFVNALKHRVDEILDPALRSAIKKVVDSGSNDELRSKMRLLRNLAEATGISGTDDLKVSSVEPMADMDLRAAYPLIEGLRYGSRTMCSTYHVLRYVNAFFTYDG